MKRGELAKRTGCNAETIRYYEKIGLLPEPGRTAGGQRRYDRATLDRLAFIRHSRQLGFPLVAVREPLDLSDHPDRPCDAADAIAARRLREVERRLARLEALRTELLRMPHECAGGKLSCCRVIEVLRDHGECLTEDAPKA